ncbi:unnamed protein product, partial [Ostreobium quekettii]
SFNGEGSCEGESVEKETIADPAAAETTPAPVLLDLPKPSLTSVAAAPGVAPGPSASGPEFAFGPNAAFGPSARDLDEDVIDNLVLAM